MSGQLPSLPIGSGELHRKVNQRIQKILETHDDPVIPLRQVSIDLVDWIADGTVPNWIDTDAKDD